MKEEILNKLFKEAKSLLKGFFNACYLWNIASLFLKL